MSRPITSNSPGAIRSRRWFNKQSEEWREEYKKNKREYQRPRNREQTTVRGRYTASSSIAKAIVQRNLRCKVLDYLGGKCSSCGFTDIRALQVDHIAGGGVKHTKSVSWSVRYKQILGGASGFQILCANCNWIKRAELKEAKGRPRL